MNEVKNNINLKVSSDTFIKLCTVGSSEKSHLYLVVAGLLVCSLILFFGFIFGKSSILIWTALTFSTLFLLWVVICSLRGSEFAVSIFVSLFIMGLTVLSGATEAGSVGSLGIDISTILRILLLFCALIIGLWYLPKYYYLFFQRPLFWLSAMVIVGLFSTCFSDFFFYSLSHSISLFATVLFGIILILTNTSKSIITSIFWTLTTVLIYSWITFFVLPDIAVYETILWNGEIVWRFEGISNHPNTLGLILGVYFGIVLVMYFEHWLSKSTLVIVLFFILVSLLFTESKTAILATGMSGVILYSRLKSKLSYFLIPFGGLVVIMTVVIVAFPEILNKFLINISRSGDASEVLSFTGRLGLWIGAWEAIKEAPLFGYGYMSTRWVLGTFAPDTWEGMHAHNMIIEGFIFFGLAGSFFLIMIYIDSFIKIFKKKLPMLTYFIPFTLLVGVTETSILARSLLFVFILAISLTMSLKYNSAYFKLQLKNKF